MSYNKRSVEGSTSQLQTTTSYVNYFLMLRLRMKSHTAFREKHFLPQSVGVG